MSAVGASEVISQEAPTDWIRPPKLEARLASQSARKMWYLNGVKGDARTISRRRGGESFMADENVARSGGHGHGRVIAFEAWPGVLHITGRTQQSTPSPLAGEGCGGLASDSELSRSWMRGSAPIGARARKSAIQPIHSARALRALRRGPLTRLRLSSAAPR